MNYTENEMKEILEQDLQIPKKVDGRLQDTYSQIRSENRAKTRHAKKSWRKITATAAVVAITVAVTGGTAAAAYLSEHTDFFQSMFGNTTKTSQEATQVPVDPDKNDGMMTDIPGKEYVSVDEQAADVLIGDKVTNVNITKEIGGHTLTIDSILMDGNSVLTSMTLEKSGGVTALVTDEWMNRTKGANFSEDSDFVFSVEDKNGNSTADFMYIDTEKSTEDKYYIYDYMVYNEETSEPIAPMLHFYSYAVSRRELKNLFETDSTQWKELNAQTQEEYLDLPQTDPIPMKTLETDGTWICSYSPISMSVNMAAQNPEGLDQDPYCIKYIEIKYKDGTNYVVTQQDVLDNTSYICGFGTKLCLTFNRLINPAEVSQILINDNVYLVNE